MKLVAVVASMFLVFSDFFEVTKALQCYYCSDFDHCRKTSVQNCSEGNFICASLTTTEGGVVHVIVHGCTPIMEGFSYCHWYFDKLEFCVECETDLCNFVAGLDDLPEEATEEVPSSTLEEMTTEDEVPYIEEDITTPYDIISYETTVVLFEEWDPCSVSGRRSSSLLLPVSLLVLVQFSQRNEFY